jgi:hypothetical protein
VIYPESDGLQGHTPENRRNLRSAGFKRLSSDKL